MGDLELVVSLSREFNEIDRHPYNEERVRRGLLPLLEDDQVGVVYVDDPPPEGYAVVTWGYSLESGGRDALLDEIYTRRRGEGRGGLLLEEVMADLTRRGLPRVFLETEAHNQAVRRFYARHGFVEEDSIWMARDLLLPGGGEAGAVGRSTPRGEGGTSP